MSEAITTFKTTAVKYLKNPNTDSHVYDSDDGESPIPLQQQGKSSIIYSKQIEKYDKTQHSWNQQYLILVTWGYCRSQHSVLSTNEKLFQYIPKVVIECIIKYSKEDVKSDQALFQASMALASHIYTASNGSRLFNELCIHRYEGYVFEIPFKYNNNVLDLGKNKNNGAFIKEFIQKLPLHKLIIRDIIDHYQIMGGYEDFVTPEAQVCSAINSLELRYCYEHRSQKNKPMLTLSIKYDMSLNKKQYSWNMIGNYTNVFFSREDMFHIVMNSVSKKIEMTVQYGQQNISKQIIDINHNSNGGIRKFAKQLGIRFLHELRQRPDNLIKFLSQEHMPVAMRKFIFKVLINDDYTLKNNYHPCVYSSSTSLTDSQKQTLKAIDSKIENLANTEESKDFQRSSETYRLNLDSEKEKQKIIRTQKKYVLKHKLKNGLQKLFKAKK